MDLDCTRKTRSPPDWSKLPQELLGFLTTKLVSADTIRFKAVCPSWNRAATSYISSPSYNVMDQTPLLMIPSSDKQNDPHTRRFFSLAENKTFTLRDVFRDFPEAWCVGSSHGWLVLMDATGKMDLFNPFSEDRIELPSFCTLPHFVRHETNPSFPRMKALIMRTYITGKVVTSCNPSCNKDFAVVITHSLGGRLAFCKVGDNRCTWTDLGEEYDHYSDIMFHNGQLYTVTSLGSVGVWDLTKSLPSKVLDLHPCCADGREINKHFPYHKFDVQQYLVESSGDLLFVWRFIVKTIEGRTFPHKTEHFHIFRLSSDRKDWEKVEYLHDRALFLGGNHSMSVSTLVFPECQENSIYFTDDNYYEIALKHHGDDKAYAHDHGVYNLEGKVVQPVPGNQYIDKGTIYDPLRIPFWVCPYPWPSTVSYGTAPSSSSPSGQQP